MIGKHTSRVCSLDLLDEVTTIATLPPPHVCNQLEQFLADGILRTAIVVSAFASLTFSTGQFSIIATNAVPVLVVKLLCIEKLQAVGPVL